MYGTPNRCIRDASEEETEIADRPILLNDVAQLINDISVVAEKCNILARGSELVLGEYPLISMKVILEGHIKSLDEIDEKWRRKRKKKRQSRREEEGSEDSSTEFQLQEPLPAIINPEMTLRLPDDDFIPEPEKRLRMPSIEDDEELASRWPRYGDENN
ncbi:hypothetical protein ENUP19_0344G0013 [Entamoeba nuttalli]|uniref:Uncharacterized protein n=1 Tax=Entamoeba nuttalli TaxID=412467 RepID=A0ABQ0DXJ4_9EUKA